MTISLRFLEPPAICAICGRECDPDRGVVIAETGTPQVDTSAHGTHIHCDVTPGSCLIICEECAAAD